MLLVGEVGAAAGDVMAVVAQISGCEACRKGNMRYACHDGPCRNWWLVLFLLAPVFRTKLPRCIRKTEMQDPMN
jgi:hypothetical protein